MGTSRIATAVANRPGRVAGKKGKVCSWFLVIALAVGSSGCQQSPAPQATSTATRLAPTLTAAPIPPAATATPTATPTSVPPTATNPPTEIPTPTSTATAIPPTATPTPSPLPATATVCADGCDFGRIQAAIDDAGTTDGAIIEVTDPVHTKSGIVVNKNVTLRGLGAGETIVQGHPVADEAPERIFLIEKGATVVLAEMTIRHGKPSNWQEHGGGIWNQGTLTLRNCIVTQNVADGGGGIYTSGTLTLINSTVSENTAEGAGPPGEMECGAGGGIKCGSGTLTVINSTIHNNQAGIEDRGWGGGVHVGCGCTAVFTNSTISGNRSASDSGGIRARGTVQLVNCTISHNHTSGYGGGIWVAGRLDFTNTIIANNRGLGGDCAVADPSRHRAAGTIGTNRSNLVESNTCSPDFFGDPLLGPLADNGGDTWTHALLPGSPAIDAVSAVSCTLVTDQRGALRPVVQTSSGTPCDIGAVELQAGG